MSVDEPTGSVSLCGKTSSGSWSSCSSQDTWNYSGGSISSDSIPTHSEEELPPFSFEPHISEEEDFHSQYKVLRTIGQGSNAKVLLAQHRLTGTPVAIKVLEKGKQWFQSAMMEANIMRTLNHPNIISLLQVTETKKSIYLVMEFVEGQQLYQYIKNSGHIEEDEARKIFKQLIAAVSYCHEHGIVHRDLKPDNILIDNNGKIKIIDFGLSTKVKPGQMLSQHCGSYSFGAPEFFLGKRYDGTKSDSWTLGVVLYFMIVGKVPFDSVIIHELQRQVVAGVYPAPCGVSQELEDLLSLLLTIHPTYRPTPMEVMLHPWFKGDWKMFPNPCKDLIPDRADPTIVQAMEYLGFRAQDILESLRKQKYNQAMACYTLLKGQALQRHVYSTVTQTVSPVAAPFPTIEAAAAFTLGMKTSRSAPILGPLVSPSYTGQESTYGQKARQRAGRTSTGPGFLHLRPLQWKPTEDQQHIFAMSVPCINTTTRITENSSNSIPEDNPLSHSASENKPIPSRARAQPRGFRGWAKRIRNAMRRLCCCFTGGNQSRRRQHRVSPQK
ncbi:sperm motility kinase Y-like [Apodemus sylvaticus]|uniref:sperm motility kinase Y-like n=1 Tax=Apodemus sylvaticus TaxID=10129 RepID=UPI002243FB17|nr:sperm motility kinase Y-like [Apodemus sylvaticus]